MSDVTAAQAFQVGRNSETAHIALAEAKAAGAKADKAINDIALAVGQIATHEAICAERAKQTHRILVALSIGMVEQIAEPALLPILKAFIGA